ncbi:MAG TPA: hypothetical protein VG897_14045, partial [Terriglobales bacterium]|nr:hypothetical protein [Terriglobales bacterium]
MAAPGLALVQDLLDHSIKRLRDKAGNGSLSKMESASKAQQELEKIEKQIQQLESLARDNQEASHQLSVLHEQVNA